MAAAPPPLAAAPWRRGAARDPRLRRVAALRQLPVAARLRLDSSSAPTASRSTSPGDAGGDPFEEAVAHPLHRPRRARALPRGDRRGQLGELALLALPGRRRAGRAAPGLRCSASTGRCASSGCRPSSCRGPLLARRSGWPGSSCSPPAGPTPRSPCPSSTSAAPRRCASTCSTSPGAPTRSPRSRTCRPGARVPAAPRRPPRRAARSRCSRCPTGGCSSRRSCTGRPSRWARCSSFGLLGRRGPQRRPAGPGRHPGAAARRDRHRVQPGQGAAHPRQLPPRRRRHRRAGAGGAHRPARDHDPAAPHPGPRARAAAVVAAGRAGGGSGSTSPAPAATGEGEGAPRDDPAAGRHARRRPAGARAGGARRARRSRLGRAPCSATAATPRGAGRPPAARWLDPLSWRRNGWADVASAVLLRTGRLTRRAIAVPHARIQSLTAAPGLARDPARPGDGARRAGARPGLPGAGPPRRRARRGLPRRGVRTRPVGAPQVGTPARPPCTRPFGVGGLVPAPAGHPRTRKAVSTVNTPAPPPTDPGTSGSGVVERLGFARDQVVQEFGYDSDVDDEFRYAVEDHCGAEIEDEDYTGGRRRRAALVARGRRRPRRRARRHGGGARRRGLRRAAHPEGSPATRSTPATSTRRRSPPGLHTAGTFNAATEWRAHKLVAPRTRVRR